MLRVLPAQGKLVLQQVTWLPRNFIQSEVSIHATCNNLICGKTGSNFGGKTRIIAIQLDLPSNVAKQVARFSLSVLP